MMWEIIRRNQRRSLVLLGIMGAILVLLGYIFGMGLTGTEEGAFAGIIISLIIYFILLFISFSAGKNIMLSMSGAREADPVKYQQLYNIVEEMRLAAGMQYRPRVYVIDDPAPNAFAAGMHPNNSVVAVTTGLLQIMNRDELQGVIAHEISHIVNRDVRYMTIATIMVGTVAIISEIFLRSILYGGGSNRSRSSSGKGGQGQIILLIIAIVFAIIAPIIIQLLYFALSRKREYLADACGARLTRYPEGLASALEKIAMSTYELRGANKVNAPMYIANPLKPKGQSLRNLTSTHPPIEERIRILRAMGNSFSFESYQRAFEQVTRKKGVIPSSTLKSEVSNS